MMRPSLITYHSSPPPQYDAIHPPHAAPGARRPLGRISTSRLAATPVLKRRRRFPCANRKWCIQSHAPAHHWSADRLPAKHRKWLMGPACPHAYVLWMPTILYFTTQFYAASVLCNSAYHVMSYAIPCIASARIALPTVPTRLASIYAALSATSRHQQTRSPSLFRSLVCATLWTGLDCGKETTAQASRVCHWFIPAGTDGLTMGMRLHATCWTAACLLCRVGGTRVLCTQGSQQKSCTPSRRSHDPCHFSVGDTLRTM